MVRVKICGLTNEEDVELALDLGVDALGFVRYPKSPRFVEGPTIERLANLSGPYVQTVGVYGIYDPLDVSYTNLIQASDFGAQEELDATYVVTIHLGAESVITDAQRRSAKSLLIDANVPGEYGGTGLTVDWLLAAEFVRTAGVPVILAGGLTPDNVADAIRIVQPYAVDVCSGIEGLKGKKDPIKMRDFIQAARGTTLGD